MTRHAARRAGRRWLLPILLVAAIPLFLLISRDTWLPWLGEWLVSSDTPAPADLIVVLGGDFWGHRVIQAAELGRKGYAPHVLISGPYYSEDGIARPEGELATQFLVEKGYPRSLFWTFAHHASSTIDEAKVLAPELKRLKARRILIVTSNYHSWRASLVYHAVLPFAQVRVIGVPEEYFQPASWWKTQVSRQLTQSEWTKIMGTIPLSWILRLRAVTAEAVARSPQAARSLRGPTIEFDRTPAGGMLSQAQAPIQSNEKWAF